MGALSRAGVFKTFRPLIRLLRRGSIEARRAREGTLSKLGQGRSARVATAGFK